MLVSVVLFVFFFKQKTAYEMRISDWSSDVCSSDLQLERAVAGALKLHDRSKTVFLEQIIDRDPALLLDIGAAPQDGAVVQFYVDDARIAHEPRLSGSAALGKEKHANAPLRRKCNENETLTISRIWLMRGPGPNSGNRR